MLGGRPQYTNKYKPSEPAGFVTHPTKKPSTNHWFKEPIISTTVRTTTTTDSAVAAASSSSTITAMSTTSQKLLPPMGKPWTNRPPSFVTSSVSHLKPYFPDIKLPPIVSPSDSYQVTQSLLIVPVNSSPAGSETTTTAAENVSSQSTTTTTSYNSISTSRPSSSSSFFNTP